MTEATAPPRTGTHPAAERINRLIETSVPAVHHMGLEIVRAEPCYAEATVPLDGNGNHLGSMYAGVLFAVGEALGGAVASALIARPAEYAPVVKNLTIEFLAPARSDVTATASLEPAEASRVVADAERTGRAEFVLEAALVDTSGTLVARTHGTYQIRRIHGRSAS